MAVHRVGNTAQDIRRAYSLPEPDVKQGTQEPVETSTEEDKPDAPSFPPSLKLSRSYEAKGVRFDSLKLQAPRGVDFYAHGEPIEWQFGADGQPFRIIRNDILRTYIGLCVEPDRRLSADDMIEALDLRDARALRKAVLDFFKDAEGSSG